MLLLDDPHKNWQEAQSELALRTAQEWFDSTFMTRLEPGGSVIVLHTRWNESDVIGYCMRERREDGWFFIRIPAVAEDADDFLGRKIGQALCPERYDEKALERIRKRMSPMMWAALFQQRPAPMEGNIFKREKWKFWKVPPVCDFILQSWDTASKKNVATAFSVCQTWGRCGSGYVLLDRWKVRVQFPQLVIQAKAQYERWRPNVVLIEDRDSGQALVQTLQQETAMPVIPIYPDLDKVIRAHAISPMQHAERLFLPHPSPKFPWAGEFVETCAVFPNGEFKDDVDAMSQAISYYMTMAIGGRIQGGQQRRTAALLSGYRNMM